MYPLLTHELKYYIKNKSELAQLLGLFICIIFLIPFGQISKTFDYHSIAPGILCIALALSLTLACNHLFQRDQDSGKLEAYQLLPASIEVIIFTKWLAFYLAAMLPIIVAMPVVALLLSIPANYWLHYMIGLTAGGLAMSTVLALLAALMTGARRIGALLALTAMPLLIPVTIFSAQYLASTASDIQPSLFFLLGFTLFLLPILCFAGASSIRASN